MNQPWVAELVTIQGYTGWKQPRYIDIHYDMIIGISIMIVMYIDITLTLQLCNCDI